MSKGLWYIPGMPPACPALLALDQMRIPYRTFIHSQPVDSLEEAARQRGQEPGQVIRSLLFRTHQKSFFLVLMAGPGQVDWRRLRAHLGTSRISLASDEEVLQVTGYAIGTVTPLGLPAPLRILADANVFRPAEISIGSGVRGTALILRSTDLQAALGQVEIGTFA